MRNVQTVELNVKDVATIEAIINGKHWLAAAKEAGYRAAHRDAKHIFTDVRALAYAYRLTRGKIQLEGAPSAYNFMIRLLNNEKAAIRDRIDVAKILFAAGGFVATKAQEPVTADDTAPDRPIRPEDAEKVIHFVQEEIRRRERAAATIIDVTPEPVQPQGIDSMF